MAGTDDDSKSSLGLSLDDVYRVQGMAASSSSSSAAASETPPTPQEGEASESSLGLTLDDIYRVQTGPQKPKPPPAPPDTRSRLEKDQLERAMEKVGQYEVHKVGESVRGTLQANREAWAQLQRARHPKDFRDWLGGVYHAPGAAEQLMASPITGTLAAASAPLFGPISDMFKGVGTAVAYPFTRDFTPEEARYRAFVAPGKPLIYSENERLGQGPRGAMFTRAYHGPGAAPGWQFMNPDEAQKQLQGFVGGMNQATLAVGAKSHPGSLDSIAAVGPTPRDLQEAGAAVLAAATQGGPPARVPRPLPPSFKTADGKSFKVTPAGTSVNGGPETPTVYLGKDAAARLQSHLSVEPGRKAEVRSSHLVVKGADGTPILESQVAYGKRPAAGRVPVHVDAEGNVTVHGEISEVEKPPEAPKPPKGLDEGVPIEEFAQTAVKRGANRDAVFEAIKEHLAGNLDEAALREKIRSLVPGYKPPAAPVAEPPLEEKVPVTPAESTAPEVQKPPETTPTEPTPPAAEPPKTEEPPKAEEPPPEQVALTPQEVRELIGVDARGQLAPIPPGHTKESYAQWIVQHNPERLKAVRETLAKRAELDAQRAEAEAKAEAASKADYEANKKPGESYQVYQKRRELEDLQAEEEAWEKKQAEKLDEEIADQEKGLARNKADLEKVPAFMKPILQTQIREGEAKLAELRAKKAQQQAQAPAEPAAPPEVPEGPLSLKDALLHQPLAPQTLEGAFERFKTGVESPQVVYRARDLEDMVKRGEVKPEDAHAQLLEWLGFRGPKVPPEVANLFKTPTPEQAAAELSAATDRAAEEAREGPPMDPNDPYYDPPPLTEEQIAEQVKATGKSPEEIKAIWEEVRADRKELQRKLREGLKTVEEEHGEPDDPYFSPRMRAEKYPYDPKEAKEGLEARMWDMLEPFLGAHHADRLIKYLRGMKDMTFKEPWYVNTFRNWLLTVHPEHTAALDRFEEWFKNQARIGEDYEGIHSQSNKFHWGGVDAATAKRNLRHGSMAAWSHLLDRWKEIFKELGSDGQGISDKRWAEIQAYANGVFHGFFTEDRVDPEFADLAPKYTFKDQQALYQKFFDDLQDQATMTAQSRWVEVLFQLPDEVVDPKTVSAESTTHASDLLWPGRGIRRQYEQVYNLFKQWFEADFLELDTHTVLDQLIPTLGPGYLKTYLQKIRSVIDKMPLRFSNILYDSVTGLETPERDGAFAYYSKEPPHSGTGWIDIRTQRNGPMTPKTLVHELTHAVTQRFIDANPNHPLVKQLNKLRAELEKSREEMYKTYPPSRPMYHYGLDARKNPLGEFVAEAFSSEPFMKFIGHIEDYSSRAAGVIRGLVSQIQTTLARLAQTALGIRPGPSGNILYEIMRVGEKIMDEEARIRKEGPSKWATYGRTWASLRARGKQKVVPTLKPKSTPEVKTAEHAAPPGRRQRFQPKRAYERRWAGTALAPFERAWESTIRGLNPEALSRSAREGGAIIASKISDMLRRQANWWESSQDRYHDWQRNHLDAMQFLDDYERGRIGPGHKYEQIAKEYKSWAFNIWVQDFSHGIDYNPRDNYLPHLFKNEEDVRQFFQQRYKGKWGDPFFIKQRGFNLIQEAVKAGFKLRFTNPEEFMLARQHASDMAQMQIEMLEDLTTHGLATPKRAGMKQPAGYDSWRAPNGKNYWVHNDARQILENRFNSKSLWRDATPFGQGYRGWMRLKNALVPLRLAWPAFHGIHVLTIDMAQNMMLAEKQFLSGKPLTGVANFLKAIVDPLWANPSYGSRIIRLAKGLPVKGGPTTSEAQALQLMSDGGFSPLLSDMHRTGGIAAFTKAVRQQQVGMAALRFPGMLLEGLGYPLFQWWIPSLKASAFAKQAALALELDPSLIQDTLRRKIALRRVAESIDNRYGEMSYDVLFWNRMMKNISVASTLSLGWNLGFIREYGGAAADMTRIGETLPSGGHIGKLAAGQWDKPLFVGTYTVGALAMGGIMTKLLGGINPGEGPDGKESLGRFIYDCLYPTVGRNKDGTPQRVTTMHYTREFGGLVMHARNEGLAAGITDTVLNKGAGVAGPLMDFLLGVDKFGKEISDPNAPAYKQLAQRLGYTLSEFEPITAQALLDPKNAERPLWQPLLGFAPAPRYTQETPAEGHIRMAYQDYVRAKKEPYDRVVEGAEYDHLRRLYASKDPSFVSEFRRVADEYGLDAKAQPAAMRGQERRRLLKSLEDQRSPYLHMFQRVGETTSWKEQRALFDMMTLEEKKKFLPFVVKEHRYDAAREIREEEVTEAAR